MDIKTNDFNFINFNNQKMQWIKFNNDLVYENWERLSKSGTPPIILPKCKGQTTTLPTGYQELDFIEATGEQYINTNFYPDSNTSIKMDVLVKTAAEAKNNFIFGVNNSDGTKKFALNLFYSLTNKNLGVYPRFSTNVPSAPIILIDFEKWYNYRLDKGKYYVDNTLIASYNETFDKNEQPLYINAYNDNTFKTTNIGNTKIKRCKIWDNGILVRDLIPCYRKLDDVVGMYDIVSKVFYENAGTGNFLKGNIENLPLPDEYQQVKYIESTGTQWIDTKYIPKTNDVYKIRFLQTGIEANQIIFGSRTSGTYTDSTNQVYLNKSNATSTINRLLFFSGKTRQDLLLTEVDKYYNLKLNINNGDFDNTSDKTLFLFGFNNMGEITAKSYTRLFEFKIYNSDILVRDFTPCYRKSDGVIGLYDKVNNEFYTNEGTDTFLKGDNVNSKIELIDYTIYGNTIQKTKLPSEYQEVEYVESTGEQYIEIDYIATEITNSKGKYQITDTTKANMIFGSRNNSSAAPSYGFNWGGGIPYKYYNTYYGHSQYGITDMSIDEEIHTFEKRRHQLYIDDELIHTRSDTDGTIEFTTPYKMIVFGCNTKGTIGLFTYVKLFNLQFYDNDELKIDLIPCYRKLDNVIGMYDLVTGTFYTNKGTGVFLKGNNVTHTPTLELPMKVESVGDKSTNILNPDFSKTSVGTYSYILLNNTPKVLTLRLIDKDTSVDIGNVSFGFTGNGTNANDDFHWCVAGGGVRDRFITNNTNNGDNPIENPLMYFSVYPKSQATWEAVFKRFYIQIVEGEYTETTIPEYEPYGYKIPIKVKNKNIFSFKNTTVKESAAAIDYEILSENSIKLIAARDITTTAAYVNISVDFDVHNLVGKTFTPSCTWEATFEATPNKTYYRFYDKDKNALTSAARFNTFTIPEGTYYLRIILYLTTGDLMDAGSSITFTNIMVEYGDTQTEFEPHIEPITTNIYLNEPLRQKSNYTDYINYQTQKEVRYIKELILTGEEEFYSNQIVNTQSENPLTIISIKKTDINTNSTVMPQMKDLLWCSHFKLVTKIDDHYENNTIYIGLNYINFNIDGVNDIETFRMLAREAYAAGNPIKLYYPVSNFTENTIELPSIFTNRGTNIIEINTEIQPSNMEITYWGKE